MSNGADFETYLVSKKIDSDAFRQAEPEVWGAWKREFGQMHPNSFTLQKLNLINPIRRRYLLQAVQQKNPVDAPAPLKAVPRPGKPVIKPKLE